MTAFVQSKFTTVTALTSISVTLSATPTQGNLLVAILASNGSIASPTYPWGNSAPDYSVTTNAFIYFISKVAGASESATVSFSNTSARNFAFAVVEASPTSGRVWSGLDKTVFASSGATVATLTAGPTATLSGSDDFAVAAVALSAGSGSASPTFTSNTYTVIPTTAGTNRGFMGYRVPTSTAAEQTTATWTTAVTNAALAIATYRQVDPTSGLAGAGFLGLI